MQLNPYLSLNGNCETAFRFYEQCLGGKIEEIATFGDSPGCDQMPAEWHDKIMHVRLVVGDQVLMGSDSPPEHQEAIGGFSVALAVDDPQEAERLFYALAENGTVRMPVQETFWAARFGMLVDQFGVPWMINCLRPSPATAVAADGS